MEDNKTMYRVNRQQRVDRNYILVIPAFGLVDIISCTLYLNN